MMALSCGELKKEEFLLGAMGCGCSPPLRALTQWVCVEEPHGYACTMSILFSCRRTQPTSHLLETTSCLELKEGCSATSSSCVFYLSCRLLAL